ncbi:hypothetical protein SAMN04487954_10172 [Billgrantia gudaonensis]|uniref:Uncharacterized protein n=1 Tax=Billgrantia gudaonensis TaxID=376427 RepID=A0A1G8MPE1_9GAMM|nr:hypothetical protein SAMN04487954_10172 [Halomonas gudaonensis]
MVSVGGLSSVQDEFSGTWEGAGVTAVATPGSAAQRVPSARSRLSSEEVSQRPPPMIWTSP